jgi:hypothetical protein
VSMLGSGSKVSCVMDKAVACVVHEAELLN